MATLDELSHRIIELLQQNGRASNAALGRSLGVSEGTVRRRIKWLREAEVIKVVAYPDPKSLGYYTEALVGLHVDLLKIDAVATSLSSLHEISLLVQTTGAFDFFAWVASQSITELGKFLSDEVGTISGVRGTQSFVILSVRKRAT